MTLVAACGGNDDGGAAPTTADAPEASVGAAPPDAAAPAGDAVSGDWVPACELLTDAEVSGMAGAPVMGGEEIAPSDLDGCVWTGPGTEGSDYRVTRVQRAIAGESAQAYLQTLQSDENGRLIEDVGDGGVVWSDIFGTARAAIWDGDTVVFVFMDRGTASEVTVDEVLPLARAAGNRL